MFDGDDFWFQQDGAPAHTSDLAKNYLDSKKPGKWVGKRGPIPWPPRSPDLTPPDFFLWGFVKDRVYSTNPQSVEELIVSVTKTVKEIPTDMCARVCRSVKDRLAELQQAQGGHLKI